jgi:hypothetical protein
MTHVVDTVTNAVTTFENFYFNSFAEFAGKYLGAGPDGISQIDDESSVEQITSRITTAELHFGSEFLKRVSDFYLSMRSKGDLTLRVFTDELEPYEYVLTNSDIELIRQGRALIGKGARGKYWQFQFEMSEDFDFDSMNIAVVVTSRRI